MPKESITLEYLANGILSGKYGDFEVRIQNLDVYYKPAQALANYYSGLATEEEVRNAVKQAVIADLFDTEEAAQDFFGEWYV